MNKQWFYSKISSFYNEDDIGRIESIYLEDEENDLDGFIEDMVVGREYDFSVGLEDEKISPETLLDQVEKIVLEGLKEKHGSLYGLNGICE